MGRFEDALARPGLGAIAEIKRRSPSAGDLRPEADPAEIAPAYAAAGAAAISVLVDERFGGTWDDLRAARAATRAPLLAKGFFSTDEHLRTAKEAGADAALLLLRDLDDSTDGRAHAEAAELGLDTLVEAHDAEELDRGIALGARVLGVNARDLSTFAIDRRAQLELVARVPADRLVDRGERDRHPRPGRRRRARRRGRDPRRLDVDAGARPGRQARGAHLPPAREGMRAHARGGRRRRGRGRRRPGRLRPRPGEPPRGERGARRPRRRPLRRGLGRRGGRVRGRPRPGAHGRGGQGARPRGNGPPGGRGGGAAARPSLGGTDPSHLDEGRRSRRARVPGGPARAGQRARRDRRGAALGGRRLVLARVEPGNQGSRAGAAIRGGGAG